MRPVLEFVRTVIRPNPDGRCFPIPDAPVFPTRDAENMVGRRTAEYAGREYIVDGIRDTIGIGR